MEESGTFTFHHNELKGRPFVFLCEVAGRNPHGEARHFFNVFKHHKPFVYSNKHYSVRIMCRHQALAFGSLPNNELIAFGLVADSPRLNINAKIFIL